MEFETRTLGELKRIGFSDKEARVYIAILALGQGDVTDIARRSALKRSIVYVVLEHLLGQGAVSIVPGTKIKRYSASDPEVLLQKSESAIVSLRRSLDYYVNFEKANGGAIVKFYDKPAAMEAVYAEQDRGKDLKIISSGQHLVSALPTTWENWKSKIKSREISLKGWKYLLNTKDKGTDTAQIFIDGGATVRFLAGKGEAQFDFVIWDKSVSITSLEHKPNMTVIESKKIHDSFSYFFDLLFANASS